MKSRLDELYEARETINSEILRIKRIQNICNHVYTPLIYDPYIKDGKEVDRWHRRCVKCDKVEYTLTFDNPEFDSEFSFKRRIY